jgi:predicted permease
MFFVLAQMSLLIACGSLWRVVAPVHIPTSSHRRALTDLVFYILLPAMVLDVIWQAPLDSSSLKISFIAVCGLVAGISLMWLVSRFLKTNKQQTGALLLAATFPNATYLGLPVLDQVLGSASNSIVLQYDFFACTPILLSLGILIASRYGASSVAVNPLKELIKTPPLWAVMFAVLFNIFDIEQPEVVKSGLSILAGGVVPLMLIALGMSIRWHTLRVNMLPYILPPTIITLVLVPASVYLITQALGYSEELATASILLAAMPTMVFGIVICERYELDSEVYAAAVTLSTVCSLISLPIWFHWLT